MAEVTLKLTLDQVVEINNGLLAGRDWLRQDAEAESIHSDPWSREFVTATLARAQEWEDLANLIIGQAANQGKNSG